MVKQILKVYVTLGTADMQAREINKPFCLNRNKVPFLYLQIMPTATNQIYSLKQTAIFNSKPCQSTNRQPIIALHIRHVTKKALSFHWTA